MEAEIDTSNEYTAPHVEQRAKIEAALARDGLRYVRGGRIVTASLATPSRTFEEFIRDRDVDAIEEEFKRAQLTTESNPREAVSAASNILQSVCKIYIADDGLTPPKKQDLSEVWSVVRKHLGFDPGTLAGEDLKRILSGLISIADGVGALRTHASSALQARAPACAPRVPRGAHGHALRVGNMGPAAKHVMRSAGGSEPRHRPQPDQPRESDLPIRAAQEEVARTFAPGTTRSALLPPRDAQSPIVTPIQNR